MIDGALPGMIDEVLRSAAARLEPLKTRPKSPHRSRHLEVVIYARCPDHVPV
jgi:hypothetical protein